MKLDIEEIRQSPRAFVDLETVILLSDRVMALEMRRDELAAQNAMLLEALYKCAVHLRPTCAELFREATEILAFPNSSADWLRKHDAQVLRKAAAYLSYAPIPWNELRRMAAELEGEGKSKSLNPVDLRIETFITRTGEGGFAQLRENGVRITHTPSGKVIECASERSQHANKAKAFEQLAAELEGEKQ